MLFRFIGAGMVGGGIGLVSEQSNLRTGIAIVLAVLGVNLIATFQED